MKAYVVIGGYDYEGCDFASLKLFDCKSSAENYKEHLIEQWNYDYVHCALKEIDPNSSIK